MPIAEQLRLAGSSIGFAGAHGAGMSMTAFLPSSSGVRTSVLELFPRRMTRQITHAWVDYKRWAIMNNVDYYMLARQPDTANCIDKDFRTCGNMSVDIAATTATLRRMLLRAAQSSTR
mmetsp:Transcript_35481/g.88312  ORF Transcript_35481/g.88312 Transcript_35481/m.88312 type:complete len:118 (-) Transcript_35481:233-586(-)